MPTTFAAQVADWAEDVIKWAEDSGANGSTKHTGITLRASDNSVILEVNLKLDEHKRVVCSDCPGGGLNGLSPLLVKILERQAWDSLEFVSLMMGWLRDQIHKVKKPKHFKGLGELFVLGGELLQDYGRRA